MLKLIDSRTVAPEDIRFDPTTYHFTRKSTGEDITDQIRRADKVRLVSDFDIERENFRLSSERGSGQGQYGLTELDDSILSNLGSQIVNDGVFAAPLETLDNTVSQFWKSSGIRTLIAIAAVGLTAYIYLKFFRQ